MKKLIIAAKNKSVDKAAILAQELVKTRSAPAKEREEPRQ